LNVRGFKTIIITAKNRGTRRMKKVTIYGEEGAGEATEKACNAIFDFFFIYLMDKWFYLICYHLLYFFPFLPTNSTKKKSPHSFQLLSIFFTCWEKEFIPLLSSHL